MKKMTYSVKANKTAADVVANNDVTIATGLTLKDAQIKAIEAQNNGWIAAWPEKAAAIVRTTYRDENGDTIYQAATRSQEVRVNGWLV